MESAVLNAVASLVNEHVNRRQLATAAGLGLTALTNLTTSRETGAKKQKGKKVTLCLDGQTVTVKKNKQKPLLARGAARGACPAPATCLRPSENLQAAIAAAASGASLQLCAGTWPLLATITIDKSLTLSGAGDNQTLLDGQDAIRVMRVNAGTTVTLRDLTVMRGKPLGLLGGGGISNAGHLTLRNVSVSACTAETGGGIFTAQGSALTLAAGSRVQDNTATNTGGGVHANSGTVRLEACQVTGNEAGSAGGGLFSTDGMVTLSAGSNVTSNTAYRGGGIEIADGAITLEADSNVSGNTSASHGGGIFNLDGTVTLMANSHVTGNSAVIGGGGVWTTLGTVTQEAGSDVANNDPDDCATPDGPCP